LARAAGGKAGDAPSGAGKGGSDVSAGSGFRFKLRLAHKGAAPQAPAVFDIA